MNPRDKFIQLNQYLVSYYHRRSNGVNLCVKYGIKWRIYVHEIFISSFKQGVISWATKVPHYENGQKSTEEPAWG